MFPSLVAVCLYKEGRTQGSHTRNSEGHSATVQPHSYNSPLPKRTMKTFTAALSVLFVVVFCHQATSSPISLHSGPCCVEYNPGPLPLSRVKNYVPTGSHCSQPAVIFTTIKNKLVCANPNDKWVKDIMNQLKDNKHSR
uniref:Chemokine interleukin-8-like domain-containing protein n=1 Tax=Junco hyemalis TaxID=40217 RepID=A0A8C5NSF1_JUNHY